MTEIELGFRFWFAVFMACATVAFIIEIYERWKGPRE